MFYRSQKHTAMQDKISIIDAGLACEDEAPAYFEIEYSYPKWRGSEYQWRAEYGTARVSLETCFDALNEGKWERYEDDTVRMETQVWNGSLMCFQKKIHVMPLRNWVEKRLFDEGFFNAARTIISHLNNKINENTIHEIL